MKYFVFRELISCLVFLKKKPEESVMCAVHCIWSLSERLNYLMAFILPLVHFVNLKSFGHYTLAD